MTSKADNASYSRTALALLFIYLFIYWFIDLLIDWLIYVFICLFIYLIIIYLFVLVLFASTLGTKDPEKKKKVWSG